DGLRAVETRDLNAHPRAMEILGSDLEPAIVRSGNPLGYTELDVDLMVLERRVVAIAKQFAQSRYDLLETVVHLSVGDRGGRSRRGGGRCANGRASRGRRRRLAPAGRRRSRQRIRGLEHPNFEVHGAL